MRENQNENKVVSGTQESSETKTPEIKKVEEKLQAGKVDNCYKLNLRRAPSLEAKVLTMLNKNQTVVILNDENELWYSVKAGALEGFVMKQFVTLDE